MAQELTLLIPAYNEAARLADAMERFSTAVRAGAVDPATTEIVLVDDGSTDATAAEAEHLLAPFPHHRVLRHPANRGKGAAVRTGVQSARTPLVAFLDADMSLDPLGLPELRAALGTCPIAVASRTVPGSVVVDATVSRVAMSRIFNHLVTAGTGMHIRDTQCGFKAFRTPVARLLFHLVGVDGFAFDVEILRVAHLLGLPVAEVPVHCHNVGGSSVHPFHHARAMLSEVRRSRRGLLAVPPVAALTFPAGAAAVDDVVTALAGPLDGAPVPVVVADDRTTVLLPLVDPAAIGSAASALEGLTGPGAVARTALDLAGVAALGPLGEHLAAQTA